MKFAELDEIYHQPLFDLISQSRAVHLEHWRGEEVQRCSLLSIKTGGCSEDCAYCAQSARYSTGVEREELLLRKARGQVVDAAQMRAAIFTASRRSRDLLMAVADRLAVEALRRAHRAIQNLSGPIREHAADD